MKKNLWEYGQNNPVAPTASMNARHLNEDVKNGMAARVWPIDGDALAREAAAELGETLRSIVAGPKLSGTAWVQVLP